MSVKVLKGNANDGGFLIKEEGIEKDVHITRRELETLALVARGVDKSEIATILGVSENTVRNHVYNIMKKLGANSHANAIVKGIENEMLMIERDKSLVGYSSSDYLLCAICGRAYLSDDLRVIEKEPEIINHVKYEMPPEVLCGYKECTGTLSLSMRWDEVRKKRPDYPKVPEYGAVYEYETEWMMNGL